METKAKEAAVTTPMTLGSSKLHTFPANPEKKTLENTVFNITLFEAEVQKAIPVEGKLRLYVMDNPNDPDKFTISNSREKGDYARTKLVLDLDPIAMNKTLDTYSLKANNGYIDLTASKFPGKDTYSVYQHNKEEGNKYVGFASEPNLGVIVGNVFDNKTEQGFSYQNALINPSKFDASQNSFINIHKPADTTKNSIAVAYHLPIKTADTIIQLSKKGREFIANAPGNADLRVTIGARNPDSISPQVNFSDLNVYVVNKENNEKVYLGSGWSKEQFNSLPTDIVQDIVSETYKGPSKTNNPLEVGSIIEFPAPKDFYLNHATENGIIEKPLAVGTVKGISPDGTVSVSSPIGDVTLNKADKNIEFSTSLKLEDFKSNYSVLKTEVDSHLGQKIAESKKKDNSVEKTKNSAKTSQKEKAVATPSAKKSAAPKKGKDQGMTM